MQKENLPIYVKPSISDEIILTVDNSCLAGNNSVATQTKSIEHEDAGSIVNDGSWNSSWE